MKKSTEHSAREKRALDTLNAIYRRLAAEFDDLGHRMVKDTAGVKKACQNALIALDRKVSSSEKAFNAAKAKIKSPLKFDPFRREYFFATDGEGTEVFRARVERISVSLVEVKGLSAEDAREQILTVENGRLNPNETVEVQVV